VRALSIPFQSFQHEASESATNETFVPMFCSNYFLQKVFSNGNQQFRERLMERVESELARLCDNEYGQHVAQTFFIDTPSSLPCMLATVWDMSDHKLVELLQRAV
jgi:aromatic ring-cleaving dioxygenase